jgi:hypothetical protein
MVVTEDGKPFARAHIVASDRGVADVAGDATGTSGRDVGTTDSEGRFASDTVPPSTRSLRARGYYGGEREGVVDLAAGSEPAVVRIIVAPQNAASPAEKKPGAEDESVFVVHVRAADESPVSHAAVSVFDDKKSPALFLMHVESTESDEAGNATFHRPSVGHHFFTVKRKSFAVCAARVEVDRLPGEAEIRVATGRVSGTIVGLDGSPVSARVRVRLLFQEAGEDFLFGSLAVSGDAEFLSDADGRFAIEGIGDGEYQLALDDRDRPLMNGERRIRAGMTGIRLIAPTAAEAERLMPVGELTDAESGLPIRPPIAVLIVHRIDAPAEVHTITMSLFASEPGHVRALNPLTPGAYQGTLSVLGYRPVPIGRLAVPDGDHAPRIVLALTDPIGRVEGVVRGADGRRPPGDIRVRAEGRSVSLGADGAYVLAVPRETGWSSDVELDGDHVRAPSQHVKFEAPGVAHADFVVEAAGAIRVRLPAGRSPKFRVVVTARPLGHADDEPRTLELDAAWVAANGFERTLGGVAAGRYRVSIAWDGDAWPASEVEVKLGETTALDVRAP